MFSTRPFLTSPLITKGRALPFSGTTICYIRHFSSFFFLRSIFSPIEWKLHKDGNFGLFFCPTPQYLDRHCSMDTYYVCGNHTHSLKFSSGHNTESTKEQVSPVLSNNILQLASLRLVTIVQNRRDSFPSVLHPMPSKPGVACPGTSR